jgi:hypothetical protein
MTEFVVSFRLPGDAHLFIRHGTNVWARNAKDAIDKFRKCVPEAYDCTAEEGMVVLYGMKWATWDYSGGARFAVADKRGLA